MRRLPLVSKITFILSGTIMALVIALSPIASADPTIHYAKRGGVTVGACDSWANACDLQYALTTAISGTEIWIAHGVYTPGLPVTSSFQLKSGVALYGGFALTETARDQRDWRVNLTILSGDIDGNDTTDTNGVVTDTANLSGTNAYHVLVANDTDATTILDGLIVTAGNANGDGVHTPTYQGGGLYSVSANPVVRNVTFSGNRAWFAGGGMYSESGSPVLTGVIFHGNRAADHNGGSGGGLYVIEPSAAEIYPMLNNVTFRENQARFGGGMYSTGAGALSFTNGRFIGNRITCSFGCSGSGGGLYLGTSAVSQLTNIVFSGNLAEGDGTTGGAMWVEAKAQLTNVTFSGNRAGNSGGAIYNHANLTLVNCILWGNYAPGGPQIYSDGVPPAVTYSDIQGSYAGAGNISLDPQFTTPVTYTAAPTITGDYRLQITSPAIDAGNNLSVTVNTELDGHPRKVDVPSVPDTGLGAPPIVDMGAYEGAWPIARAGVDQTACSKAHVQLDGSTSSDPAGNVPLTYGWTQTGGGPVVLSSHAISQPTFIAPTVISQGTTLTFTLVVTNSVVQVSTPAIVAVNVNLCLYLPLTLNQ